MMMYSAQYVMYVICHVMCKLMYVHVMYYEPVMNYFSALRANARVTCYCVPRKVLCAHPVVQLY